MCRDLHCNIRQCTVFIIFRSFDDDDDYNDNDNDDDESDKKITKKKQ